LSIGNRVCQEFSLQSKLASRNESARSDAEAVAKKRINSQDFTNELLLTGKVRLPSPAPTSKRCHPRQNKRSNITPECSITGRHILRISASEINSDYNNILTKKAIPLILPKLRQYPYCDDGISIGSLNPLISISTINSRPPRNATGKYQKELKIPFQNCSKEPSRRPFASIIASLALA
jgi:hypothetical protein